MEQGLVARESALPFQAIHAGAVRGRGPKDLARNSVLIMRGIWEARAIIRRERPAAVLGTGGYVCFPLLAAARMLGVPTMIYSPDIVPGLAVKSLSRIATRVACSFEPSLKYLPREKTVVTGYPVRPDLFTLDKQACRDVFGVTPDLPVLLVYGGSRGARNVNRAIQALLPDLLGMAQIIHVCGREGDETWLRAAAEQLPAELQKRYHLFPYLHSGQAAGVNATEAGNISAVAVPTMVEAFGAADLAIARAGASTLAELPAARLPAVLVPLVAVKQDENANYLAERGAAVSVPDDAMLGQGAPVEGPLFQEVRRLLLDSSLRAQMAEHSAALARPNAAIDIADELLALAIGGGARQ